MTAEFTAIPEHSLRQLKSALFVAENRNITKAAKLLNRTQTAITKAIADLEQSLGKTLFDRSSTGMMPTVYGEALCRRVKLAVKEYQAAGEAYRQFMPTSKNIHTIPIFSMDISYKRLAAFIALYEARNIGCAAQRLSITKATVYNSINQLEELLALKLFEREPNGVAPTAYCHVLARHIKLAFTEINHAAADLAKLDGITEGHVVIGTLPYSRTYLTPRAITRLLDAYPNLDVTTQEGPYSILEAALRSGDIDFIVGAVRDAGPAANIYSEILFEDRLAVIARKGHPLTNRSSLPLTALQNMQWVLPGKQTPSWQLFEQLMKKNTIPCPEHAVYTSSLSMVRGLLLDSDRVALLSEHQIYYDKLRGLLEVLPVDLEESYRPIGITMRSHTQPSPAAKLMLQMLREVAAEITSAALANGVNQSPVDRQPDHH